MERKKIRLKEYDYSRNGWYFVTVCTADKQRCLSRVVGDDAHIVPTEIGKVVEKYIRSIAGLDRYVIMPNHIHLIIRNDVNHHNNHPGPMWASAPTISQKVKSFKILVTKQLGHSVFQRSFYDHIIRDEADYLRICEYIQNNPFRWTEDEYYC